MALASPAKPEHTSDKANGTVVEFEDRFGKNVNTDEFVLEEVIGLTVSSPSAIDCNPVTGIVAFPAACMLVLMHPKKNEQKFIESATLRDISCVKFSTDGRFLGFGETGVKPIVTIWNLKENKEHTRLNGCESVKSMLFHPTAAVLVLIKDYDPLITLWDYNNGSRLASCKWQTVPLSMTIPQCGSCLIVSGYRKITYYNLTEQLFLNNHETNVFDEKKSVLLGKQSEYIFVDLASGKGKHSKCIYSITSCGYLCKITLGDILIDKAIKIDQHAYCLKFGIDHLFIGCCAGVVKICDPENLSVIADVSLQEMLGPGSIPKVRSKGCLDVYSLVVNEQDGIVTCSYADDSMHSWQIKTILNNIECTAILAKTKTQTEGGTSLNNLDCETKFSLLRSFIGCFDKETKYEPNLFRYTTPGSISKCYQKLSVNENRMHFRKANALRFTPDGKDVLVGNEEGEIKVYDAATGVLRRVIEAHSAAVTCIDLLYDDSYQLVCSGGRDRVIFVLNAKNDFSLVQVLEDHSAAITALNIFHNEAAITLVSAAADNIILIRRAISGGPLKFTITGELANTGFTSSFFMSNDYIALSGKNSSVVRVFRAHPIFDSKSFKTINCTLHNGKFRALAIDPSGSFIAISQGSGHITIYYLETGHLVASLPLQTEVTGIKFTSDMKYMKSYIDNKVELVWRLPAKMTEFIKSKQDKQFHVEKSSEVTFESYVSCVQVCSSIHHCENNQETYPNINHHNSDSDITPSIDSLIKSYESDFLPTSTLSASSTVSYSTSVCSSFNLANDFGTTDSSIHINSLPASVFTNSSDKYQGSALMKDECVKVGAFRKQNVLPNPQPDITLREGNEMELKACLAGPKERIVSKNQSQKSAGSKTPGHTEEDSVLSSQEQPSNKNIEEEERRQIGVTAEGELYSCTDLNSISSSIPRKEQEIAHVICKTTCKKDAAQICTDTDCFLNSEKSLKLSRERSEPTGSPSQTPSNASVKDLRLVFENTKQPLCRVQVEKPRSLKREVPNVISTSLETPDVSNTSIGLSGLKVCDSCRDIDDIINCICDCRTTTQMPTDPSRAARKRTLKRVSSSHTPSNKISGACSPRSLDVRFDWKQKNPERFLTTKEEEDVVFDSQSEKTKVVVRGQTSGHAINKLLALNLEPKNMQTTNKQGNGEECKKQNLTKIKSPCTFSPTFQNHGSQDNLAKGVKKELNKSCNSECIKAGEQNYQCVESDQALDKMTTPNIARQNVVESGNDSKTFNLNDFNKHGNLDEQNRSYHKPAEQQNCENSVTANESREVEKDLSKLTAHQRKQGGIQLSNSQETYSEKMELEDIDFGAILKHILNDCQSGPSHTQVDRVSSKLKALFTDFTCNVNELKSSVNCDGQDVTTNNEQANELNWTDRWVSKVMEATKSLETKMDTRNIFVQIVRCIPDNPQFKFKHVLERMLRIETSTRNNLLDSFDKVPSNYCKEKTGQEQRRSLATKTSSECPEPRQIQRFKDISTVKECKNPIQKSFTRQFLESLKQKTLVRRKDLSAQSNFASILSKEPNRLESNIGNSTRNGSSPLKTLPKWDGFAAGLGNIYKRSKIIEGKTALVANAPVKTLESKPTCPVSSNSTERFGSQAGNRKHVQSKRREGALFSTTVFASPPRTISKKEESKTQLNTHCLFTSRLNNSPGGPEKLSKGSRPNEELKMIAESRNERRGRSSAERALQLKRRHIYRQGFPSPCTSNSCPSVRTSTAVCLSKSANIDGSEDFFSELSDCTEKMRSKERAKEDLKSQINELFTDHSEYLKRLKEVKTQFEESIQALSRERRQRKD